MKRLVIVFGIFIAVLAMLFVHAPEATASERHHNNEQVGEVRVVTWAMPSWIAQKTPSWPQQYVTDIILPADTPGALQQAGVPDCGFFQQDVYRYTTNQERAAVQSLIAGGVLTGPNSPPEPLIQGGWDTAYRLVNAGPCVTPTPTPTPTPTITPTPTPTPTPTVTPTPTPTPTPTVTPTPTPTPTHTKKPSKSPAPDCKAPGQVDDGFYYDEVACELVPVEPQLPHTGIDPRVAGFALVLLLIGAGLVFLGRKS